MKKQLYRVTLFWEYNGREKTKAVTVEASSIENARFRAIEHATKHVVDHLIGITASEVSGSIGDNAHYYMTHRGTLADFVMDDLLAAE